MNNNKKPPASSGRVVLSPTARLRTYRNQYGPVGFSFLIVALSYLLFGAVAFGQPPDAVDSDPVDSDAVDSDPDSASADEPALIPPRILQFIEAAYPSEALAEGLEATVELSIIIGVDGDVIEAEVVDSQGHGFDEAARNAVAQFRFSPASRGGVPFRARIRYRYIFELTAPEPVEPEVPLPGRLEGLLLDQEHGRPMRETEVILSSADQSIARRAITSEEGRFQFDGLPAGLYDLRILAEEFRVLNQAEEVRSEEITEVTYRLERLEHDDDDVYAFGARAVIEPPPREVTRRTLPREVLTRIPGLRGDALRAIEILPGVARPPLGVDLLVIRGSAPGDSQVFVEGAPLPALFHFGGLTSVINSHMVDRIDFFPGNFSVRYGRKMGGIVEVDLRDPSRDGFHGSVELSPIDASIVAEFPLGEHASAALAVRRSIIDVIFNEVVPDSVGVVASPVYYDYQAFVTYRPTEQDRLRFMFYGSNDRFEVNINDATGDDPNVRGNAGLTTRINQLQFGWRHHFSSDTVLDVELMGALWQNNIVVGEAIGFDSDTWMTSQRVELRHRVSDRVRLTAGLDSYITPFSFQYTGPVIRPLEGTPDPPNLSDDGIAADFTRTATRPALYVESDLQLLDGWQLVLGARVDYDSQIARFSFDPRMSTTFDVGHDIRLKAGLGVFHQPPRLEFSSPELRGNQDLDFETAIHWGLGMEWDIADGIRVGVDGFYKTLSNRVVQTPRGDAPFFTNDGIGRIYGAEISARVNPQGRRWFGYLSYTLSRSERQDHPGDAGSAWRLFDFDQTHIFTLSGAYRLGRGWEVGGTLRLVTGIPATAPQGSVLNVDTNTYTPVYASINTDRNPLFHRLDVRVEKTWTFDDWKFSLYLDIQNVYNQRNQEGLIYNYNYTQTAPIGGLPIIPALGIRGEI